MNNRDRAPNHPGAVHDLAGIVERAREGERDSVEELLSRIRPLVYRWAWVRTADRDDAEDVTQIVLVRVHERLAGFEGRSGFTSWLYRITANAAAELRRRRGVLSRLADRVRAMVVTEPGVRDPIESIEDERVRLLVSRIVGSLPDRQRTVFDLVDLEGYSPAEAAAMLDLNPATLRVHLLRARRAIRVRILDDSPSGSTEGTEHDE